MDWRLDDHFLCRSVCEGDHRLEISGSRDSLAFPVITVFIKQAHTVKLKSYIYIAKISRG